MPVCHIHNDKVVDKALLHEHHIVPRAYGGSDSPDNLIFLCDSCHGLVHKVAEYIFFSKKGRAEHLLAQYLPNEPKRRQRLLKLAETAVLAKLNHTPNTDIPDAGETTEKIKIQIEVPRWIHHRLKTAAPNKKFYKYLVAILEKEALKQSGIDSEKARPPPKDAKQNIKIL